MEVRYYSLYMENIHFILKDLLKDFTEWYDKTKKEELRKIIREEITNADYKWGKEEKNV